MVKYLKYLILLCSASFIFEGCQSTDFEKLGAETETESSSDFKSRKDEESANYDEVQEYLIQERVKEVDIPKTVVYVEKPVYYPLVQEKEKPDLTGKDAARQSTEEAIQTPDKWTNGTMYYDFDNDFTYEIYCQPYRVTDLILEPGEQVIEMPFLSEEKVWEIGAGVSQKNGIDTQHFFLKPAYSGLTTSFIIITDKRVYHMLLKSFKDCYMTQVRWNYPNTMPFNLKTDAMQEKINKMSKDTTGVDPAFLSFDYKMSYSLFKKPYWLPTRVYDDGKHTYITMNETVLHMTSPVLFNNRNERINYSVNKNLIVINELIEKVTMRVGKQKVTIKKKNYKEPKEVKVTQTEEEEIELKDENAELPPPPAQKRNSFSSVYNSKLQKETMLHSSDIIVEQNQSKAQAQSATVTETDVSKDGQ